MAMDDPIPQFSHFVSSLAKHHPKLSYVHLVEPTKGPGDVPNQPKPRTKEREESNDFLREIWAPHPLITCSEYTRETAVSTAEKKGDIIGFGRLFISNVRLFPLTFVLLSNSTFT
jgi:NADPH2 dehydrogenase